MTYQFYFLQATSWLNLNVKLDANVDAIGLRLVIVMKWQGIGNKVRNDTFQGRIQDFQRGGGGHEHRRHNSPGGLAACSTKMF